MILDRFPIMLRSPTVKSVKIVHTEKELIDFINKSNGIKNIYVNVYHFTKSKCCSTFYYFDKEEQKYKCNKCKKVLEKFDLSSYVIDVVVFDLDPDPNNAINREKEWIKAKKMSEHYEDYEHYVIKSGKGFHFYVSTEVMTDKDFKNGAKNAIKNFQIFVEKKFGRTDWITHGDTSQMIRVPGTFNLKSRNFCMCISKDMFNMNYKKLNDISEKQQKIEIKPVTNGTKKIDLIEYDNQTDYGDYIHEGELSLDINEEKSKIENLKSILDAYNVNYDAMSPCMKIMLNNEFLDYRQRYLLINVLKNLGLSEVDCEKVLRVSLFSEPESGHEDERKRYDWADHCINSERQVFYVYREHYGIPSCKSGKNIGFEAIGLCKNCKVKDIMSFR